MESVSRMNGCCNGSLGRKSAKWNRRNESEEDRVHCCRVFVILVAEVLSESETNLLPWMRVQSHNYEDSSLFLAMPSGTATVAIFTESQETPKINPFMSGYFQFIMNVEYMMRI